MDIPASLRRWFVAHFVVDLLVGLPLLIVPAAALGMLGWTVIDTVSARVVGAALLAIGIHSFVGRNDGVEAYRSMLNFKLLWSWSAIGALIIAAADGAPDPVWAFMAVFIAFAGVWFHYRVRLGQFEHAEDHELEDGEDLEHGKMGTLLSDPSLGHEADKAQAGNAEKVHAGASFDQLGAEDIAAFAAQAKAKQEAEAPLSDAELAARAAAELAAWEASDDGGGEAPANKTLQGVAASADELGMDDIAAMLAANQAGENEPAADANPAGDTDDAAGADDIAAMLAASQAGEDEPAAADALASDDIAAMLAANQADEAPAADAAAVDDIAAMLAANQADDDQGSAADLASMLAAQTGESDDQPASEADAIAAMLAANSADAEPDAGAADMQAANQDKPADAEDDASSAADIAAMLAAQTGGDDEIAVDVDVTADEPSRSGATIPGVVAVPSPEEVHSDNLAPDDIAALLANRGRTDPG